MFQMKELQNLCEKPSTRAYSRVYGAFRCFCHNNHDASKQCVLPQVDMNSALLLQNISFLPRGWLMSWPWRNPATFNITTFLKT